MDTSRFTTILPDPITSGLVGTHCFQILRVLATLVLGRILYDNTSGSRTIAIGENAGRYQADGSTALTDPENSVYIGYGARGYSNADDNSIVIGYNSVGIGANTAVLGK